MLDILQHVCMKPFDFFQSVKEVRDLLESYRLTRVTLLRGNRCFTFANIVFLRYASVFLQPVSDDIAPGYHSIVHRSDRTHTPFIFETSSAKNRCSLTVQLKYQNKLTAAAFLLQTHGPVRHKEEHRVRCYPYHR